MHVVRFIKGGRASLSPILGPTNDGRILEDRFGQFTYLFILPLIYVSNADR